MRVCASYVNGFARFLTVFKFFSISRALNSAIILALKNEYLGDFDLNVIISLDRFNKYPEATRTGVHVRRNN